MNSEENSAMKNGTSLVYHTPINMLLVLVNQLDFSSRKCKLMTFYIKTQRLSQRIISLLVLLYDRLARCVILLCIVCSQRNCFLLMC